MRLWGQWRKKKTDRLLQQRAKILLTEAEKVDHFRQDLLSKEDLQKLRLLKSQLKNDIRAGTYSEANYGILKNHLTHCGGTIYPRNFWAENGEVFLVASILALAIRTFFLQPFQIPTNSMWPSYSGMTWEKSTVRRSNFLSDLIHGRTRYQLKSPGDGCLFLALNNQVEALEQQSLLHYQVVHKRLFGIWPVKRRQYCFLCGNQPVYLELPPDFDLESLILKEFFPQMKPQKLLAAMEDQKELRRVNGNYLELSRHVKKGEIFLNFNLIRGDMLFVDRLTYHFRRPHRGETVVFQTQYVPALAKSDRYYIKRLVGLPMDRLMICDEQLFVNGKCANFHPAIQANNEKFGRYRGYLPLGALQGEIGVPPHHYYVLGDNSGNSYDSRFFGSVPEKAIKGRPLFIFYPLRPAIKDETTRTNF